MRSLRSILLTGGAGFIGSSLVRHLLKEDEVEKVVILDKLTYAGRRENIRQPLEDPRCHFVQGDVCDAGLLAQLFAEHHFSGVFHLAAESHVDRSIAKADDFVTTNILGTSLLLDQAREHEIPLLHCSTDEVYGPIPSPEKAKEDAPLRPSSPYAASKASADLLCQAAHHTHGTDIVISRCTNNYGPRQHPEKLIPLLVQRALRDEPLPIYGNGLQIRDWIHVDDHCRGLIAIYRRGRSGDVYHLAGHRERTNIGVARSILDALRKPHSLIEHVADRPGHDLRYALDTEKAMMWFGWQPLVSFQDGFADTIRALSAELREEESTAPSPTS
ncbi:dTDP-glucose 4,6-dehydratase [Roseibacillus ishigakijimensis]|uniref:dTDP-glucose 4,6-dehydratase n=1 Tax=Roseibacillus ishigakijimensis TaxID=454146 RepID=A0A934VJ00_9BACT|nr:dTDP-glucose 4,6-dehydratase [Roseibacillus ishigakijimensis]MBK1835623.1 dTDP-glucose 4,6-dehydratase [Roseibacillus ishigakijimensis]